MAKKTLTERFIQNTVAERLNKEYYRRKPAYVNTEVYTQLKRADVFIAFMRARKRPYVIVVEAKSRTTIHQLKLKEEPQRIRWAGRGVAIALIVGLSAALGYQWYFNAMNTLLLLAVFVLGSSLISSMIRRLELSSLGSISAIEQLSRYPANEKWIAVGEDTFVRPEEYEVLKRQCRKSGLGLLVVTTKGKMRRILIPEPRHAFNNYLSDYGKRKPILAHINKRPDYGPTPPERAKQRRQVLNGAVLLSIVGLLALLTYEDRVRPVVPDPFADSYPVDTPMLSSDERVPVKGEDLLQRQGANIFPKEQAAPTSGEVGSDDTSEGGVAGAGEVERQGATGQDCSALVIDRRSFIVVDAILNPEKAKARLAELSAAGIPGMQRIATDCLNSWPAPGRETLYTGTVYPDRPAAAAAARAYNELLKAKGMDAAYGKAVKVRPGG
ncbi:hypothetical protein [Neolewinella persica]|uniref:hypothetical protein n=1 Tax=Neolewinella persica TaxID=70998 RepID=UPI00037F2DDF|nr:hypothetical protein [Neolewinella persica]